MEIRDNGSGVDPNNVDKIWGMFYKGDPISTGNGLGLYITKKAVDALKGTIKIDTKHGEFCLFVIELPFLVMCTLERLCRPKNQSGPPVISSDRSASKP